MVNKKEEAVLVAATRLFSEFGYHAVGVDKIISNAKVAKMTFYKYFPSKEDLIEKVLARRDQHLRESITSAVAKAKTPMGRLKAIFNWYDAWFRTSDFHGCMFINASAEFPEPSSRTRQFVQRHKTWLARFIEEILRDLGVHRAKPLSVHLMVVLDGLTVKLNMYDDAVSDQVKVAWNYAKQLVELAEEAGRSTTSRVT